MEASPVLKRTCAGLTVASLVSLLLAACEATTSVPRTATDGPHVAPEARPRPDWVRAEARGWLDQAGFSLMLPPGWTLTQLQGMDSNVWEITGDGVSLMFDYGWYSWDLNPGANRSTNTSYHTRISVVARQNCCWRRVRRPTTPLPTGRLRQCILVAWRTVMQSTCLGGG